MEIQITAIHRDARASHLAVVETYFDLSITRSQFKAMKEDSTPEIPRFQVILAHDLGRFAGSPEERREWMARLAANGAVVVAAPGGTVV